MAKPPAGQGLSCPSSLGAPGARLHGVLGDDGRIGAVIPPLAIDEAFVAKARAHGPLEARFRFAGPCVESGCVQWTGSCCGVIAKVMASLGDDDPIRRDRLPRCGIRGACRWHAERGPDACRACAYVVTDPTGAGPPVVVDQNGASSAAAT